MFTRSVPDHSGRTTLTTLAMLLEIAGGTTDGLFDDADGGCGLASGGGAVILTGTVTDTGPAPTTTFDGSSRAPSTCQLLRKMPPKMSPPTTNVQNVATANGGGPPLWRGRLIHGGKVPRL